MAIHDHHERRLVPNRPAAAGRMARCGIALALLLCGGTAGAAPAAPVVSPELEPDQPATTSQTHMYPAISFDGTNYLVIWVVYGSGSSGWGNYVKALRVDAGGTPLDASPIELGRTDQSTQVAFNGTHHLVLTVSSGRVFGTRIATDGTKVDPSPVQLTPAAATNVTSVGLGSDGANWLLTYGVPTGQGTFTAGVSGMLVGPTLTQLTPLGFALSPNHGGAVAFDGTQYWVTVGIPGASGNDDISALPVSTLGIPGSPVPVSTNAGVQQDETRVACDRSGHCLVSWRAAYSGLLGARLAGGPVVDSPAIALGSGFPGTMVHDGAQFVAATSAGAITVPVVIRVPTTGPAGTPTPLVLSQAAASSLDAVAAGAADDFVVWVESFVTGARIARDGTILAGARVLAAPMNAETLPTAAPLGAGFLVAWNDDRSSSGGPAGVYAARLSATGAALDPAGLVLGSGSLVALGSSSDGTNAFVVWSASDIRGARVSLGGTVLDPGGKVLASGHRGVGLVASSFNGTDHLVVWHEYNATSGLYNLVGVRVTTAGTPRELPWMLLTDVGGGGASGLPGALGLASDGAKWLVATRNDFSTAPLFVPDASASVIQVGADGSIGSPVTVRANGVTQGGAVSIAYGGGKYLLAYEIGGAGSEDIEAVFVAPTTPPTVGTPFLVASAPGSQKRPTVTWDGTHFLVAWEDGRSGAKGLYATVVDATGAVASTTGTLVSSLSDERGPYLASAGGGRGLAVYQRLVTRPGQSSTRARARFLASVMMSLGSACASGPECATGFCVDGVCCNTACGGGGPRCQACSVAAGGAQDGVCGVAAAGTVCRPAAGPCDVVETCDGASLTCPSDAFAAAGSVCRAATGPCDAAETCTGTAASCPPDALSPAGTVCRPAATTCDAPETCTGTSATCPPDVFQPFGTECAPAQPCSYASTCTGGLFCPAVQYKPSGVVCGVAADLCDVAAHCTGWTPLCPANSPATAGTTCRASAGPCDPAETCNGSSIACPLDMRSPVGTVCRPAAGPCDTAETCDGSSAACPPDAFAAASTVCRAAAGPCDVAEHCTGLDPACPPDLLASATTICRPAEGDCDVAEACTGGSPDCPADAFRVAGTVCRPAAGACDVAETCTGSSATCPADGVLAAGTICRAAAGACDAAEVCNGTAVSCPSDLPKADGTACAGGTCQAGVCQATTPPPSSGGGGGGCGYGSAAGDPTLLAFALAVLGRLRRRTARAAREEARR
jgi:hypothetical protein